MSDISRDLLQIPVVLASVAVGVGLAIAVFRLLRPRAGRPFPGGLPVRFAARALSGFAGTLAGVGVVAAAGYSYTLGPDCGRGSTHSCFEGVAREPSRRQVLWLAVYMGVFWAGVSEWTDRKSPTKPPAV